MLGNNRSRRIVAYLIAGGTLVACSGDQFSSVPRGDGGPNAGGTSSGGGSSGGSSGKGGASAGAGGTAGSSAGRGGTSGNVSAGGSSGAGASSGSGGSSGGGGTGGKSAGTVTLELKITGTKTYCDNVGGGCGIPLSVTHISVTDAAKTPLSTGSSLCAVDCATCVMLPCPGSGGPGPGGGCGYSVPFGGATLPWDGAYTAQSTCGANVACSEVRYAAPGQYIAVMCATPGHMATDAGVDTCVNTGPVECVDVPFDYPGAGTVTGTLGN